MNLILRPINIECCVRCFAADELAPNSCQGLVLFVLSEAGWLNLRVSKIPYLRTACTVSAVSFKVFGQLPKTHTKTCRYARPCLRLHG